MKIYASRRRRNLSSTARVFLGRQWGEFLSMDERSHVALIASIENDPLIRRLAAPRTADYGGPLEPTGGRISLKALRSYIDHCDTVRRPPSHRMPKGSRG